MVQRLEVVVRAVAAAVFVEFATTTLTSAVELAIKTVEAKIRRWEETLENGLLSLKECAARIKELRGQREDLLRRQAALQKQTRGPSQGATDTDGADGSIYRKEFLREILKEVRVRGNEVRLTYKLPMTVRTPLSKDANPQKEEFFTLNQMVCGYQKI